MCRGCKARKIDHSGAKNFGVVDKPCTFCGSLMYGVGHRRMYCDACQGTQAWRQMKHKYGLSLEEYKAMLTEQGGVCKICKRPDELRSHLSVDHCHATGKIRGLLCDRCNTSLGKFRDDPELLRKAADYLEAHMG